MNVRDMTTAECEAMLVSNDIGHLGCISLDRPYVVPIRYTYRDGAFYSFSLPGRKIDGLRSNPQACVQIQSVTTPETWQSVLLEGRYQELPNDRKWQGEHMLAWSRLQERGNWWEPGAYKPPGMAGSDIDHLPIFYSLQIESLSGRCATPS